jgi:methyl-accepting chemotaxis protein
MQLVGPQVALGVDMAGQAGTALRQINEASVLALSNISEVAAATTEQSQASACVARNVEQISGMLEESAASVRAANEDVLSLEQLSRELHDSVARFRV